jgi:hypothetical protein
MLVPGEDHFLVVAVAGLAVPVQVLAVAAHLMAVADQDILPHTFVITQPVLRTHCFRITE